MKRDTLAAVLLALLAVVALGVAAATLDSAVTLGGSGFGGAEESPGVGSDGGDSGLSPTPSGEAAFSPPAICVEELREPPALLLLVGIVVAIGAFAYRDTRSPFAAVVVAATLGLPISTVWWLVSFCRPLDVALSAADADGDDAGVLPEGSGGEPGLSGGGGDTGVSAPEALLVAVVALALLASVIALLAAAGDDEGGDGDSVAPDDAADDPDLAAIGRTAGEAADRIESSTADNEVYRAWRDMTEVLDVERPDSSTPAEFADAAVSAGIDEGPVDELTAVFERVRYGGEDPTDEREARAVEALRRIESRHGDGGET